MLLHRILTVIVLIPLVLAGIFLSSNVVFVCIIAGIATLAAWEWGGLIPLRKMGQRILYAFFFVVIFCLYYQLHIPVAYTNSLFALLWLWAFAAVVCFAKQKTPLGWQYSFIKSIGGMVVLLSFAFSVFQIQTSVGPYGLLFGLCMVWASDTGAYFAGKKWGRHRLAEKVSPKKSWEGVLGGILLAFLVYGVFVLLAKNHFTFLDIIKSSLAVVGITVAGIFGDLFESMLKREINVKDSSNILPGHGGVLDRIDALLAAMPIFAILITLF